MILRLLSSPHVIPPHIAVRGRFCNAQYFYFSWAKIPIYVYHLFSSSLFSPCHQKAVWKIRRTLILLTIFFGRTIESWRLNFLGELYHLGKTNKSYCLHFLGELIDLIGFIFSLEDPSVITQVDPSLATAMVGNQLELICLIWKTYFSPLKITDTASMHKKDCL